MRKDVVEIENEDGDRQREKERKRERESTGRGGRERVDMKVLVTTAYGSKGDVLPFFGIALELRRRGHEVVLFVGEAQYAFVSAQRHSGELKLVEVKGDFDGEEKWKPGTKATLRERAESMSAKWLSTLRVLYHALDAQLVDPTRTVLVSHPLNFAARLLQEKRNCVHATVVLQPWLLRSCRRVPLSRPQLVRDCYPDCLKRLAFRIADSFSDACFLPTINAFAEELGIPKARHASRLFDSWFLSPERVLLAFPEWFCPMQQDWPRASVISATQFPLWTDTSSTLGLPDRLMDFLAEGQTSALIAPPVVITAGTANPFCSGAHHFLALAQAVHAAGRRSIILTSEPSYVPPPAALPAGCTHFTYLPLPSLLQHCSGCIHHGGIGTTAECLRAGVPQLIIPTQFDQFDNADLLEHHVGVGITLQAEHVVRVSGNMHASETTAKNGDAAGDTAADVPAATIYTEAAADAVRNLMDSTEIRSRCRDVAIHMKDLDDDGHLNDLCCSIEKMLAPGLAFSDLDFSSALARGALFQSANVSLSTTVGAASSPSSSRSSRGAPSSRTRKKGGVKKILTKLQYELLMKQQSKQEPATVIVAVDHSAAASNDNDDNDDNATPNSSGSKGRGSAKSPVSRRNTGSSLVRKISNQIRNVALTASSSHA